MLYIYIYTTYIYIYISTWSSTMKYDSKESAVAKRSSFWLKKIGLCKAQDTGSSHPPTFRQWPATGPVGFRFHPCQNLSGKIIIQRWIVFGGYLILQRKPYRKSCQDFGAGNGWNFWKHPLENAKIIPRNMAVLRQMISYWYIYIYIYR